MQMAYNTYCQADYWASKYVKTHLLPRWFIMVGITDVYWHLVPKHANKAKYLHWAASLIFHYQFKVKDKSLPCESFHSRPSMLLFYQFTNRLVELLVVICKSFFTIYLAMQTRFKRSIFWENEYEKLYCEMFEK